MSTLRSRLVPLAIAAAFVGPAPAQVPEGSAVVGTYYLNGGLPGLYVVDLKTAEVLPITGLPAELTAQVQNQGTWTIALRSSDGAVIVGALNSGAVIVHVLHLTGLAVTSVDTVYLGTPTAPGIGGACVEVLPGGDIYVSVAVAGQGAALSLASGPLAPTGHGIIDTSVSPPTVAALPAVSGFPTGFPYPLQTGNAVLDPTGNRIYQLFSSPFPAPSYGAYLMTFDFATFTWCTVANWPFENAKGIVIDDDGTVHVSASVYQTNQDHVVHSLRPDGCSPGTITTVASSVPLNSAAFAMDRRSGQFLQGSINGGAVTSNKLSLIDPTTGAVTFVTDGPAAGWARIAGGLAVNDLIESYGPVSDGQNRYSFVNFPNPGGEPIVGNTGFSLSTASTPNAPLLSVLGLSLGRGSLNALGVQVLLDLGSLVAVSVPAGTATYLLPIPANAGLAGIEITAQSLNLEAGGNFAASRGLSFVIGAMPAPTIVSVSPVSAVAGATITVEGEDFWSGPQLQIGGVAVPIVSQTAQSLTFVMPVGVGCDGVLTLTSLGGAVATAINATPVIMSSPSSIPAAGGTAVIIDGSNLMDTTVTIAGNPMTILSQSQARIVGLCPAGPLGPTTLVVSNAIGCQASAPITLY